MIQQVRLRSFKTKKEKEVVPSDDDVPWFQAATFALSLGSTLLGGKRTAQASKADIIGKKISLEEIDKSLALMGDTASAQKEAAKVEYQDQLEDSGKQMSNLNNKLDIQEDVASSKQGFAYSGEILENVSETRRQMNEQFTMQREGLLNQLDKTLANITEWQTKETNRLNAEKRKLRAGIQSAEKTSTTFKALGFG